MADLVLSQGGEAVAGELAVGDEDPGVGADPVVVLALLEAAVGRDGAELQVLRGRPGQVKGPALGPSDAVLLGHADVCDLRPVGLDLDQRGQGRGRGRLGQELDVVGRRPVIGLIEVQPGFEVVGR